MLEEGREYIVILVGGKAKIMGKTCDYFLKEGKVVFWIVLTIL